MQINLILPNACDKLYRINAGRLKVIFQPACYMNIRLNEGNQTNE